MNHPRLDDFGHHPTIIHAAVKNKLRFGIPHPPRGEVLCGEVPGFGVSRKREQHVVIEIIRKNVKYYLERKT